MNFQLYQDQLKQYFLNLHYKNNLLPQGYKTFAIEYGTSADWYKYVRNEKYLININNFGKSGTEEEILEYFELDYESVKNYISELLK